MGPITEDTALKAAVSPISGGSIAPVAGVYNEFRVIVNVDGFASFYIDGNFVGSVANAVTPTVLLTPTVVGETRTTAAKTFYVDALAYGGGSDTTP
jgi:hypothetical protein